MIVHAPTLWWSEKDRNTAYVFYNELESHKKLKSRDSTVITGNFKAKTRTAALEINIYKKADCKIRKRKSKCQWLHTTEAGKITVIKIYKYFCGMS